MNEATPFTSSAKRQKLYEMATNEPVNMPVFTSSKTLLSLLARIQTRSGMYQMECMAPRPILLPMPTFNFAFIYRKIIERGCNF